jgi:hypothetical protein
MQELQDGFDLDPNKNTWFNSTVMVDDDNIEDHEDCHMEDDDDEDGVEISPTHTGSFINEKCLLDELLQTEEVMEIFS